MKKILNFKPKKPDMVWECPCGGVYFLLYENSEVECRECKLISQGIFTTTEPPDENT